MIDVTIVRPLTRSMTEFLMRFTYIRICPSSTKTAILVVGVNSKSPPPLPNSQLFLCTIISLLSSRIGFLFHSGSS